eukprot:TRINITY_DN7444_c0_g1_i1.p1 TRINITY_DN7444_c0_g1~~TRINITY_DN7444_c0_g1_i1.p1  ORF type:complete len:136 (-),score=6.23 TRINITY_DN7444_c0_g1_i1:358-765(-)
MPSFSEILLGALLVAVGLPHLITFMINLCEFYEAHSPLAWSHLQGEDQKLKLAVRKRLRSSTNAASILRKQSFNEELLMTKPKRVYFRDFPEVARAPGLGFIADGVQLARLVQVFDLQSPQSAGGGNRLPVEYVR